jgi:hypothetical protein
MDGGISNSDYSEVVYSHSDFSTAGDTKFTVDPTLEPLSIPNPYSDSTNRYNDHTLLGEHEFNISVNWIPNLPFAVPGVPTN